MARAANDSPPPTVDSRWKRRIASAIASVSTALAHAPENAAYGLIAMAPLGAAFAPTAMAMALLATIVSNLIASFVGQGLLVNGQRAALSLLTAGLAAALSTELGTQTGGSTVDLLTLVAVGLAGAGLLQVVCGLLKLGSIIKYTPYPVRVGVTSGVGLLLIIGSLPVLLGHSFGSDLAPALQTPQGGAVLVGLCALAVTAVAARIGTRLPSTLLGLVSASVLHTALAWSDAVGGHGGLIGTPTLPPYGLAPLALGGSFHPGIFGDLHVLALVGAFACTAAAIGSLDALLAMSIVDGRLRWTRDANRELAAQGLGNIAAAVVAMQATSPSILRSLDLVANREQRHIVAVYAAAMLALLLFAPGVIGLVPVSAVGGVLLLQGVQMVAPAFWRAPIDLWRERRNRRSRSHRGLGGDWAVELAVALSAVAFGLGPAVLIGATFAVLLFVRANMRDVVRHEWSGQTRRSLKTRPARLAGMLAREGTRIAVLELEGSLFFGTADGLRARLDMLEASVEVAILDLHQVTEIDVTAARILFEAAQHWRDIGKRLVFAEWGAGDARRQLIETLAAPREEASLYFADTTDLALEQAEDDLLARSTPDADTDRILTLADTMIGRGLDEAELALVTAELQTMTFARGDLLFRVGDPGDGLYISLKGDIGLRIPGGSRRLASFAPGVTIGEMAMLARGTRSAEAVAESDVTAMRLPIDAFDRLMQEHPVLAAKLLTNIALHLGERVRVLTGDLSRWVIRSAAGRAE